MSVRSIGSGAGKTPVPPPPSPPSRRPYLIRAIYEWALDANLTPYLLVAVNEPGVVVPPGFARDGRIALDISAMAVRHLDLTRDPIYFSARFGGVAHDLWVPARAVLAIYARENGEGLNFGEPEPDPAVDTATSPESASEPAAAPDRPAEEDPPPSPPKPGGGRPRLRVVK